MAVNLQSTNIKFAKLKRHNELTALPKDHVLSATPSLLPPLTSIAPSFSKQLRLATNLASTNSAVTQRKFQDLSLMGIPGLTLRLINRGQWITMEPEQNICQSNLERLDPSQGNPQRTHRSVAILDGPGLAYYVCKQYRADNLANSLTELNPAYSDIGARAIQFLEDMEAVGLRM